MLCDVWLALAPRHWPAAGESTPQATLHTLSDFLAAPDNYDSVINGGKHAIVEFYAPCEWGAPSREERGGGNQNGVLTLVAAARPLHARRVRSLQAHDPRVQEAGCYGRVRPQA